MSEDIRVKLHDVVVQTANSSIWWLTDQEHDAPGLYGLCIDPGPSWSVGAYSPFKYTHGPASGVVVVGTSPTRPALETVRAMAGLMGVDLAIVKEA